ncbi:hypothetical protein KIN20_016389 [Parelaphostrongylus tenuis]|uniref:Uncharacterized protein n=1 Tax=Parelaphostrongylus tenuis TaxID=148309 RepID=A0AAD5N578_PARTN|nr:hypothetical protein KIN20_016389 [Parelaphostrongylus tenuis]
MDDNCEKTRRMEDVLRKQVQATWLLCRHGMAARSVIRKRRATFVIRLEFFRIEANLGAGHQLQLLDGVLCGKESKDDGLSNLRKYVKMNIGEGWIERCLKTITDDLRKRNDMGKRRKQDGMVLYDQATPNTRSGSP